MAATRRLTECLEENMMLQGEQDVVAEQVSESSKRWEEGAVHFYFCFFALGEAGVGSGD